MYSKAVILLLLIISTLSIHAQQKLLGIIVEKGSGTPVAFATIQAKNAKSTLTNENGEFEIDVPGVPTVINISHLNYEPLSLQVNTADLRLKISVTPKVMSLKEVTVGNPAIAIMQDASDKAWKSVNQTYYGKAFLRQTAYEDDKPTYLNEIVFDYGWKSYGLTQWNPLQARHLESMKGGVFYTNTSFWTLAISGYVGSTGTIKPLTRRVDSLYTFKLEGTYNQNGQEIAKIICTPKSSIKKRRRFEGIYYVNTVTNDVIKIDGSIEGLTFTNGGPEKIKNKLTVFIAQYKLNKNGDNVLDYCIFNTSNKMTILGIGAKNTDLFSTLYMIDDEVTDKTRLTAIKATIVDADLVKSTFYNDTFWRNNQGIKRTEKEQNAIEILEKYHK